MHAHAAGHDHAHTHGASLRAESRRRLTIVMVLVCMYMVTEVVGGLLTNSLALLADAGHMMSDAVALGLTLFALWIAERPATPRLSYGYYRTEILAALVNGATLVAIAIFIFVEAWQRFRAPQAVQGVMMTVIAMGGLVVNMASLWLLKSTRSHSVNMRGAWLHVLTDAMGSVGAIVAGIAIWQRNWFWADPAISVVIGMLVVFSSWHLLRDTVSVLMESAPVHVNVSDVRSAMSGIAGVCDVHDLHVWSITSGMISLSAHVCIAGAPTGDDTLGALRNVLHEQFGIDHVTIQLEQPGFCNPPHHA